MMETFLIISHFLEICNLLYRHALACVDMGFMIGLALIDKLSLCFTEDFVATIWKMIIRKITCKIYKLS